MKSTPIAALFGSNLANVLRRLRRICAFYGSHPTFICCSATIGNPKELAESMTGREMLLIDRKRRAGGRTPRGFLQSAGRQCASWASARAPFRKRETSPRRMLKSGVQNIVFARARLTVEVLVRYLKDAWCAIRWATQARVRGYRGGYLATQRREIERELRAGRNHDRRFHQRAGAGHRHRPARRVRALRLSGHHRQHMAAGGASGTARRAFR